MGVDDCLRTRHRSTASSTCSMYRYILLVYDTHICYRPRQSVSAICIPLSVMLSPVLACRLILDLRQRGSETVAQSTGTMAFTAGVTSSKSSPGSPFTGGFGFGSRGGAKVIMRPQGVVLSTMGSIPGDAMASASGLELDNLQILGITKDSGDRERDLESGCGGNLRHHQDVSSLPTPPINGIRIDVEKTTM